MTIIILLIGISLCIAIVFLFAFIWSVRDGQYDDPYTPSIRILFDDKKMGQKPSERKPLGNGKPNAPGNKSDTKSTQRD